MKTPSDYLAISENVGNTGASNTSVTDAKISFTAAANTSYSGVNFGEVSLPEFVPDQSRTTTPGGTVFLPHTFTAHTSGMVTFSVPSGSVITNPNISGWSTQLFRDTNCNGTFDANEPFLSGPVNVNADSNSQICVLLKVTAPSGAPVNSEYKSQIQAVMSYVSSTLTSTLTVNDTVIVSDSSAVILTKQVNSATAKPGDTLTYTLSYRNPAAQPVSALVINDDTPTFTVYVGNSATCVLPLPPVVTTCTVTQQPADSGTGGVVWTLGGTLQPGAEGQVQYKVKIQQ